VKIITATSSARPMRFSVLDEAVDRVGRVHQQALCRSAAARAVERVARVYVT
jgi:hypothetical protein